MGDSDGTKLGRAHAVKEPLAFVTRPCPSWVGGGVGDSPEPLEAAGSSESFEKLVAADITNTVPAQTGGAEALVRSGGLGLCRCCAKNATVCKAITHPGTHMPITKLQGLGRGTGKMGMTVPRVQMRKLSPGRSHD